MKAPRLRAAQSLPGTDNDHDVYQIFAIYRWATGQAGLRFEYDYDAAAGNLNGTYTAGFARDASPTTGDHLALRHRCPGQLHLDVL